jgi:hypothetical protein
VDAAACVVGCELVPVDEGYVSEVRDSWVVVGQDRGGAVVPFAVSYHFGVKRRFHGDAEAVVPGKQLDEAVVYVR